MSHATIRSGTGVFGRFLRLSVLGFCLLSATQIHADTVTPTADVSTGVVVRADASSQSAAIGTLLPGRELEVAADLLATYTLRQVWDSGRINDICGYRAFLTAVRDEPGVQYHNALQDFGTRDYAFAAKTNDCYGQAAPAATVTLTQASRINSEDPIPLGQDASMRILHADGANHPNPNENTMVVRLDLGTTRVLLVGDAPGGPRANPSIPPTVGSIEQVLVTCCANALAAQILVVGHHRSMTSSGGAPGTQIVPSLVNW